MARSPHCSLRGSQAASNKSCRLAVNLLPLLAGSTFVGLQKHTTGMMGLGEPTGCPEQHHGANAVGLGEAALRRAQSDRREDAELAALQAAFSTYVNSGNGGNQAVLVVVRGNGSTSTLVSLQPASRDGTTLGAQRAHIDTLAAQVAALLAASGASGSASTGHFLQLSPGEDVGSKALCPSMAAGAASPSSHIGASCADGLGPRPPQPPSGILQCSSPSDGSDIPAAPLPLYMPVPAVAPALPQRHSAPAQLPLQPRPQVHRQHQLQHRRASSTGATAATGGASVVPHPAPVPVPLPLEPRDKAQYVLESDTETVHDGCRWRKYGRKLVAGSPHMRHYFKCTTVGCAVRKHVERMASDPSKVLVTYDYLPHTHHPPAAQQPPSVATAPAAAAASVAAPARPGPMSGAGSSALASAAAAAAAAAAITCSAGPGAFAAADAAAGPPSGSLTPPDDLPRPSAVGPRSPRTASAFSRWRDTAAQFTMPAPPLAGHAPAAGAALNPGSDHSSDSRLHQAPLPAAMLRRMRGKGPRVDGAAVVGGSHTEAVSDGSAAGGEHDGMEAESTGTDVQLFEEVIAQMHTRRR